MIWSGFGPEEASDRRHGKVVVVTGGGSGIDRHLVLELLRRNARVAATDLRPEALEGTAELAGAGDRLATFEMDVTDREATAALPEQVIAAHGAVDCIIKTPGSPSPSCDAPTSSTPPSSG